MPSTRSDPEGNLDAFASELDRLGLELRQSVGWADFRHLLKLERVGRLCTFLGLATAWTFPNPLSVFLLAQGKTGRFLVGHHVGHGAYDGIPGIPKRYTRAKFSRGWRRLIDWPEWWNLDDWRYTHNQLHHPHTQSPLDADIMDIGVCKYLPMFLRCLIFAFATVTWKFSYYAPRMHRERVDRDAGIMRRAPYEMMPSDLIDLRDAAVRQLWLRDYLPYIAMFFVLPALGASLVGTWAAMNMLANLVMAELLNNAQTFICIRPSHSAGDIPLFTQRYEDRKNFYLQSVLGTVNYPGGGDIGDFLHGWTNYQIEHHLWPSLPLLQYQRGRQRVIEICARHGVPYRQGNVFWRYAKTGRVFVGLDTQPILTTRQALHWVRRAQTPPVKGDTQCQSESFEAPSFSAT
jgi:fatty acid desaturase